MGAKEILQQIIREAENLKDMSHPSQSYCLYLYGEFLVNKYSCLWVDRNDVITLFEAITSPSIKQLEQLLKTSIHKAAPYLQVINPELVEEYWDIVSVSRYDFERLEKFKEKIAMTYNIRLTQKDTYGEPPWGH